MYPTMSTVWYIWTNFQTPNREPRIIPASNIGYTPTFENISAADVAISQIDITKVSGDNPRQTPPPPQMNSDATTETPGREGTTDHSQRSQDRSNQGTTNVITRPPISAVIQTPPASMGYGPQMVPTRVLHHISDDTEYLTPETL